MYSCHFLRAQPFLLFILLLITFPQLVLGQEITVTIAQETPPEIEQLIRQKFILNPVMITIAKCESGFRQFTDSGNVLRASGRYIGIFQIDEIIHASTAENLGFDIYTTIGNIGYASYIYDNEGSNPWRNCAKKHISSVTTTTENLLGSGRCPASLMVSEKLKLSDRDNQGGTNQVALLQGHINRILASKYQQPAGPKDGIFGPLTKKGVERLQKALNETIELEKLLIIDGIVGPFTREAINNSCGTF